MTNEETYYFLIKNDDIIKLKNQYDLPASDKSKFVNGSLVLDDNLTSEEREKLIRNFNYIVKYNKSIYYSTQTDLINFYKIKEIDGSIPNDDIKKSGRGQLINGLINVNLNYQNHHKLGFEIGKTDSDVVNSNKRKSNLYGFVEPNGGNVEDSYDDDCFGSSGGNITKNSFDFYEKQESKNGNFKLEFLSPNTSVLKPIKIIKPAGITISPSSNIRYVNYKEPETFYQILITGENKFYFTVDRDKEIDIENSYLIDSNNESNKLPLNKLENYIDTPNEKVMKKFSMECLDNRKRILTFYLPNLFYTTEEFTLDLKTKERDFYFAICRDDKIESVEINDKKFIIEDDDNNGINKKYSFKSGDDINIKITFKDDNYSLMNVLTEHYLKEYVDKDFMINHSNNKIQKLNFKMPQKDVFLPFLSENYYTLTVNKNENSTHISSVNSTSTAELPIIEKYFWNDSIKLKIEFSGNEQQFYMIDKDFMISQYPAITVKRRDKKDDSGDPIIINFAEENPDGYEMSDGFTLDSQDVDFRMPNNDLTFYLKEATILRKLTIDRDKYQYLEEDRPNIYIEKCYIKNDYETLPFTNTKTFVYGEDVDIFIKFSDVKRKLDIYHLYGQIIPESKPEPGEQIPSPPASTEITNTINFWQYFQIKMPLADTALTLQWIIRTFYFKIEYYALLIKSANYTITRNGSQLTGQFNNNLILYNGDVIKVEIEFQDYFTINNPTHNSNFSYYINPQSKYKITITSTPIASSTSIDLKIGIDSNKKLIEKDEYIQSGSIILIQGIYNINLSGAKGGNGCRGTLQIADSTGSALSDGFDGNYGKKITFSNLQINSITTVTYKLGDSGKNAIRGQVNENDVSAGGGGGGNSMMIFNPPVTINGSSYSSVWCEGGAGGDGGVFQFP